MALGNPDQSHNSSKVRCDSVPVLLVRGLFAAGSPPRPWPKIPLLGEKGESQERTVVPALGCHLSLRVPWGLGVWEGFLEQEQD